MQAAQPRPLDPLPKAFLAFVRKTPLSRGKMRRAILSVFKRHIDYPVITDFRGVPFILHMDNTTETKALFGQYNLKELAFLKAGLSDGDRAVFVDLGANCGFYTQNCLALNKGRVLAIEPNPSMCARIESNYALLKKERPDNTAQLILERCAVGDTTGMVHLDLADGFGAASVVEQANAKTISVPVELLETIMARHAITHIDVLKIDIEGYEDKALMPFFANAPESLYPRHIIIEYTSSDAWGGDLMSMLKDKGYKEKGRTRGNMMLSR